MYTVTSRQVLGVSVEKSLCTFYGFRIINTPDAKILVNYIVQITYQRTKHEASWNYLGANLVAFPCNIQKGLHNQTSDLRIIVSEPTLP
uniref:Uncharacterized protein n=1 Tax=Arundo donax TaxID=35708 RepID=A0A0A9CKZ4_ARUDO